MLFLIICTRGRNRMKKSCKRVNLSNWDWPAGIQRIAMIKIIANQLFIITKCYRILVLSVVASSGPKFSQYVHRSALVNVQKQIVKLGGKTHTAKYTDQPNSTWHRQPIKNKNTIINWPTHDQTLPLEYMFKCMN